MCRTLKIERKHSGMTQFKERIVSTQQKQRGIYQRCRKTHKSKVLSLKLRIQMTETVHMCIHILFMKPGLAQHSDSLWEERVLDHTDLDQHHQILLQVNLVQSGLPSHVVSLATIPMKHPNTTCLSMITRPF